MDIQHNEANQRGRFFMEDAQEIVAEMTYSLAEPNLMIIDHTEVSEALRGRDIGYKLVERGVNYAREKKYLIIPVCSFAKAVMLKKKEAYKDVLK